jgi:hypothetical protein
MALAHIYFAVQRQEIGANNWAALLDTFENMGTADSPMPAWNTHWASFDEGNTVIYESVFDTAEVSIAAFKDLLATEFGIDVEDIAHDIGAENYAGHGTTTWQFKYNDVDRFKILRFGGGAATWAKSQAEARGYTLGQEEYAGPPQAASRATTRITTNRVKCTATTKAGNPCKNWATWGSHPPRCAPHGGRI